MARTRRPVRKANAPGPGMQGLLDGLGATRSVTSFRRGETIFMQGDTAGHLMCIRDGGVKLSVLSKGGKEAVVAMLGPGDFFGEGCLAGQRFRMGSATAITPSAIVFIRKNHMRDLLHRHRALSDRFISLVLTRNVRVEEDLVDQLFNSSEKRLARALLLLARYGTRASPVRPVPAISQTTLAEMVGTTRSRVNFFLNKFKKLGFIDYDGTRPITINSSLLSVILHD